MRYSQYTNTFRIKKLLPLCALAVLIVLVQCKGKYGSVTDAEFSRYSLRDKILMVTKKRCPQSPAGFRELVQCVREQSTMENGYGSTYISEFSNISNSATLKGSSKDIAFFFEFMFEASESGKWLFEFAIDAGIASGCKIGDRELWFSREDIWALDNHSKAFTKEIQLDRGYHIFSLYGIEGCCDGKWRVRFKSPSMDEFKVISSANMNIRSRYYTL